MMTELAPQDAEGSYNRPKYDFTADPIASLPVVHPFSLHTLPVASRVSIHERSFRSGEMFSIGSLCLQLFLVLLLRLSKEIFFICRKVDGITFMWAMHVLGVTESLLPLS